MTFSFTENREPPPSRRSYCEGGVECYFTEGAVMVAFAIYLLNEGATTVELHPDGEHGKRFDIRACLESHGFALTTSKGTTSYGGTYQRDKQQVIVTLKPGLGDAVAQISGRTVVAECKGGVVNSRHAGQLSKLRRGLCEAIGLLMARPLKDERHMAVIPAAVGIAKLARRIAPRATTAGIEIALVGENGSVTLVGS